MNLQEFEIKLKKKFRPDLNLPIHIRRKIFQIYKFELYKDLEEVVEKELMKSQDFLNFTNIQDLMHGDRRCFYDFNQ